MTWERVYGKKSVADFFYKETEDLECSFSIQPTLKEPYVSFQLYNTIGHVLIRITKRLTTESKPHKLLDEMWKDLVTAYKLFMADDLDTFQLVAPEHWVFEGWGYYECEIRDMIITNLDLGLKPYEKYQILNHIYIACEQVYDLYTKMSEIAPEHV